MTSTPESTESTGSTEPTESPAPAEAGTPASSAGSVETSGQAPDGPRVAAQPVPTTPTPEELELAAAALHDVTPRGSVGDVLDALLEGGQDGQAQVLAIRHASTLPGYPDWTWTVLLSRGLEGGPTVLELALLPGDGSLLAPAWVPWSERLADYLAAKEAAGIDGEDDDELESDLDSDLEDDFDDDFVDEDEDDEESDGWGDVAGRDVEPGE